MKKRITIYLDEGVWTEFRIRCLGRGESASSAIEGLIVGGTEPPPKKSKVVEISAGVKEDVVIPENLVEKPFDLEAANAKLMETRKLVKSEDVVDQFGRTPSGPIQKGGRK